MNALLDQTGFEGAAIFRAAPRETNWAAFLRDGFDCATGHLTAREAMAQVLIMPAILILWALAFAIITASV